MSNVRPSAPRATPSDAAPAFAEAPAWSAVGAGWRPIFGNFRQLGFSFEWHDFTSAKELDWARSFHPGSVELCLNLDGAATLKDGRQSVELGTRTYTFYHQGEPSLVATRRAGERHRFITVEFSPKFLGQHFLEQADNLHPIARAVVKGGARGPIVTAPDRLTTSLQQLVESLHHCPVFAPAQEIWFRCKALELAALVFFRPATGEFFCTRAQRAARERVERARAILKERLHEPPSLEELGKLVGSSPFYLSRIFSQETGQTIQQYLRQVRMERAAELLRTGK